ncbi:HlyD family secretion protein [Dinghuibacter silviterrae]|uniref:Membrane fusion protein (Multidrug efflux system) n=1 Tax=Dinghuibacter silviterrae TaxID=1539049 RepID=A0A4R8DQJ0_9BACT|nr:HlyD family secretion protein [Dinghuibacter silviterrae]TDW99390.1 membrane fusion protein (multidrug efflux system) [Dinghuibacter silviterrae]
MEQNTTPAKPRKKLLFPIILGLVLLIALGFTLKEYIFLQSHEETDDAQIDGDISPVIPRVSGYVTAINFQDNQFVHAGDTLVVLDDKDYKIKLDQANAALTAAQKNVAAYKATVFETQSNFGVQKANIEEAQVRLWKAEQDYDRYKNLYDDHVITKAQFDQATADKESAQAALDAAKSQIPVLDKRVNTNEQQTTATASIIDTRKADVEYAQLQLSYTVITAPASGIVSKRNIQIGQLVQAGTPMFSVVHDSLYITANFKETQMNDIRIKQAVDVSVDAFPNDKIQGTIESVSGATGAKFSLLPPDNATGNFVKVVQRVPVRIKLDVDSATMARLRPGMSVKVTVHTK